MSFLINLNTFFDEDLNDLLNSELSLENFLLMGGRGEVKLVTFDRLFWIADWLIGETQKWMGASNSFQIEMERRVAGLPDKNRTTRITFKMKQNLKT